MLIAIGTTLLLITLAPKSQASYISYEPRPSIDEVFVRQYWPEPAVSKITPGLSRQQEEQALVSKTQKKTVAKAKVKQKAASSFVVKQANIQSSVNYCSCVTYVKSKTGYSASVGAARNWPINSATPSPGSVVVTREGSIGHVALVVAVVGSKLILDEANYSRCKKTYGRELPINSPVIKGFFN